MRPLTLTMIAFGPYAGKIHLDFDELKGQSLFLITGPTGSGKTTILDAMVYALFGESSGGLRSGTSMRSDYATPTEPTAVEFTFAVGDKQYKMERSPKQQVKKKRGEGFREQGAQARLLIWQDGDWVEFSTRSQEIKDKVHEILGFRAEQFLQVVLLPQGEFRKLLVAPTSEREDLMHSLFRTELYSRLQDMLKDEYDTVSAEAKDVIDRQRYLLSREEVVTVGELHSRWQAQQELVKKKDKDVEVLHQEQLALDKAYKLGEQRQGLVQQVHKHQTMLEELEQKKSKISEIKMLLNQLSAYEPVSRLEAEWQALVVKGEATRVSYEAALAKQQSLQEEAEALKVLADSLQQAKPKQVEYELNVHKAEQIQAQFDRVAALQTEIAMLVKDVDIKAKTVGEKEQDVLALQENIVVLKEGLTSLRRQLSVQNEVVRQREELWQALQIGKNALATRERCEAAKRAVDVKRRAYELAEQIEVNARLEREHQVQLQAQYQAANLGRTLQVGVPCPVCGSKEHPQLAVIPEGLRDGALQEAEAAYAEALQQTSKAKTEWNQVEITYKNEVELLEAAEKAIDDWLATHEGLGIVSQASSEFMAEAEVQQQLLDSQWQQIQHKEKEVEQLEQTLQEEEQTLQTKQADLQILTQSYQALTADLGRKEEALTVLQQELATIDRNTWLTELEAQKKWLTEFESKRQTYEESHTKHIEAVSVIETTLKNLLQQQEELDVQSIQAQSAYENALEQSKLRATEIERIKAFDGDAEALTNEVRAYEDSWGQTEALLASAKQQLEMLPEPSRIVTEQDTNMAMEAYEEAVREAAIQNKEEQRLANVVEEYETLMAQNEAITERSSFIFNLYDLANGGDTGLKGVTFERYVLGAILEEVVVAANARLRRMSRGRYTLERADLDSVRRGHRGLDLAVLDTYTGYARPANTLSGGETFLASLALAMGLADIIQAYAGGIHLDTIFIDEGFGTLDPDTLEVAMQTLVTVQESGRLVGIISHVPELKNRIPAHLEVRNTERGSEAQFVVL